MFCVLDGPFLFWVVHGLEIILHFVVVSLGSS